MAARLQASPQGSSPSGANTLVESPPLQLVLVSGQGQLPRQEGHVERSQPASQLALTCQPCDPPAPAFKFSDPEAPANIKLQPHDTP